MKKSPMATANAAAITIAVIYIVCVLGVLLLPDLSLQLSKAWIHGIDVAKIWNPNVDTSLLPLGFITATVGGWIAGYVFAVSYNMFVKK